MSQDGKQSRGRAGAQIGPEAVTMIVFLGDLLGVLFFRMGCPSMVLVPLSAPKEAAAALTFRQDICLQLSPSQLTVKIRLMKGCSRPPDWIWGAEKLPGDSGEEPFHSKCSLAKAAWQ